MSDTSWVIPLFTPAEIARLRVLQAHVARCRARGGHHDDLPAFRRLKFWRACYWAGLISEWLIE